MPAACSDCSAGERSALARSLTVSGRTSGRSIAGAEVYNDEVIRPRDRPVAGNGGLVVLRGSLAPDGAVIKPHAGDPRLLEHGARPIVFDRHGRARQRIDDAPRRDPRTPCSCCATPAPSAQACPNGGCCRSRVRCSQQGVRDMVRISDARMSGPRSAPACCTSRPKLRGWPAGPRPRRRPDSAGCRGAPDLLVGEEELSRRRADWKPRPRGMSAATASSSSGRRPGRRRLRLRFPRSGRADPRAGDLRTSTCPFRPSPAPLELT